MLACLLGLGEGWLLERDMLGFCSLAALTVDIQLCGDLVLKA